MFRLSFRSRQLLPPQLLPQKLEDFRADYALIYQVFAETLDHHDLLFRGQTGDCRLDDSTYRRLVYGDEAATNVNGGSITAHNHTATYLW